MHMLFAVLLAVTQHWLVTADLHVNPFDKTPYPAQYATDSNWPLVRSSIAEMRKADPNPDVVVIAGDFLAHRWESKARAAGQDPTRAAIQTFNELAKEFGRAFPRAQFLVALGNNDDPCGDYRTGRDSAFRAAIAPAWTPLVNQRGAARNFAEDFVRAGYYTARLPGGNEAIVLDDIYWSFFYRSCGRGSAGGDEFTWLDRTLQQLPRGVQAVPILHVPPGVDPLGTLDAHRFVVIPYWTPGARPRFETELQRFARRVSFGIAGHMHRNDVRLSGGVPLLIVSSISPIYENNPSFLRLTFDRGAVPADYQTYAFDLEAQTWSESFDFDKAYGVKRFDAASVMRVHDLIAHDVSVRTAWEHAMVGDSGAWYGVRSNWKAFWCAQTLTGEQYVQCAGDDRRTDAVYAAVAAAVAIVLLALIWYSRKQWKQTRGRGA